MGLLHEAENLEYTPSETIPTKEFHERKDEVIESEWPDPKRATQEVFVQEEVRPLRPLSAVLGLPSGAVQREDVELRSTADKRETEHDDEQEGNRQVPKSEGSSMSSGLYSPFYAGQVEVRAPDDDEHWEEDLGWDNIDFDIVENMCQGEQPPEFFGRRPGRS